MSKLKTLKLVQDVYNPDDWMTPPLIKDRVEEFYAEVDWCDPFPVDGRCLDTSFNFAMIMLDCAAEVYCNPPFSEYSAWVDYWIESPYRQSNPDQESIWLMHHDSSTKRQKRLMEKASAICLLFERVKFINPATGKPAGTSPGKSQTLIYVGKRVSDFKRCFSSIGTVLEIA